MAIIQYGANVADIRGSINGWTHSRNRYGAFVRVKITPRNPMTNAQSTARQLFSANSSAWRNLTQAQRDQWTAYAAGISSFNVFRVARVLTGQVAFVQINTLLHTAGLAGITVPPANGVVDTPFTVTTSQSTTGLMQLTVQGSNGENIFTDTTLMALIDATRPFSQGIQVMTTGYVRISNQFTPAQTMQVQNDYIARFGTPLVGQRVFFRVRLLQKTTGAVSIPVFANLIYAAPTSGDGA